jgi:hypothetical protein
VAGAAETSGINVAGPHQRLTCEIQTIQLATAFFLQIPGFLGSSSSALRFVIC